MAPLSDLRRRSEKSKGAQRGHGEGRRGKLEREAAAARGEKTWPTMRP